MSVMFLFCKHVNYPRFRVKNQVTSSILVKIKFYSILCSLKRLAYYEIKLVCVHAPDALPVSLSDDIISNT